jgi:hypothetical protein
MRLWNHVFSFTPAPKKGAIGAITYCTIGGNTSHFGCIHQNSFASIAEVLAHYWKQQKIDLVAANERYFGARGCNSYWQSIIVAAKVSVSAGVVL